MSIRAAGHGLRVFFLQFIKGSWKYGEMDAFKRFEDLIDFQVIGRGFTWKSDDLDKDRQTAVKAWQKARDAIFSDKYDMIVLDEFTYTLLYHMLDLETVLQALDKKPKHLHLIITGRRAPYEICERADLVTEMQPVKHHFTNGIRAQKGVEF